MHTDENSGGLGQRKSQRSSKDRLFDKFLLRIQNPSKVKVLTKPLGDVLSERSNLVESHWSNQWLTQTELNFKIKNIFMVNCLD